MALSTADFAALAEHKASPFVEGYPNNCLTFYSPVDDVHAVLVRVLKSATKEVIVALFGYDDDELAGIIHAQLANPDIHVQVSLDKSQAGGVHERAILDKYKNDLSGNSISIGTSEKHAIQHLKMVIVDGLDVITGSTNWSDSGETKQDNACVLIRDVHVANEARIRLAVVHNNQLAQMAALKPPASV